MEFKVGDIVRIKDWDVMEKEFGLIDDTIDCKCGFVSDMKHLCGKLAIIDSIDDYEVALNFIDYAPDEYWSFSTDMIEKLEVGIDFGSTWKCDTGEPGNPIKIIFDKNGGIEMKNEVLELWFKRTKEFINREYDEKKKEYVNSNEVVKEYNAIQNEALAKLAELYDSVKETGYMTLKTSMIDLCTSYYLRTELIENDFNELHENEKDKQLDKINEKYEEIKALLSMSDDLAYQQDILIQYGIIDKKTKKMVDIDEDSIN